MLWSRASHFLLAITLLAGLGLGWMAGGAGRLGAEGAPGIVAFELAGNPERSEEILRAWSSAGVLSVAQRSLFWDFGFIAAYVLFGVLLAAWVGRRASGGWGTVGLGAAAAMVLAGAFDVAENCALLFVLDGSSGAASAARVFAIAKFALILGALAALAILLVKLATAGKGGRPSSLDWSIDEASAKDDALLRCDLVMKGGITSGVVYPGAVFALARRYRFMSIGGSSAGAIAAALTAAAEYRRQSSHTVKGFETLRDVTASLADDGRLFKLFQPAQACAGLFDVLASALRPGAVLIRAGWMAVTALGAFPLATVLAFLPAALLVALAAAPAAPARTLTVVVVASIALTAVLLPGGLIAAAAMRLFRVFPGTGFGLCPGRTNGERAGPGLSDWLADQIDRVAFGTVQSSGPLTLGHLWCGGPPSAAALDALSSGASSRVINYEVLTTSLTHGRPYRIPFVKLPLWFRPEEIEKVLPHRIVQWMIAASESIEHPTDLAPLPEGVLPLPRAEDLPVVFLARMSLSFPFLLSAVKLIGVRFASGKRKSEDYPVDDEAPGPRGRGEYGPLWFSDGGISSNFPIHFFDQLVPSWPTFGLDLGDAEEKDRTLTDRIRIPRHNGQGIYAPWFPIENLGGFAAGLLSSLQAWMDNVQKRAPGFRDRIARLLLTPEEGGLNLQMPPERILGLARLGHEGGKQLGEWFDPALRPADGKKFPAYDNQRWIRLRLMLAVFEKSLRSLDKAYRRPPPPGAHAYQDMLRGPPPSYAYQDPVLRNLATALLDGLLKLPVGTGASLSTGAPRPEPELRITPKI